MLGHPPKTTFKCLCSILNKNLKLRTTQALPMVFTLSFIFNWQPAKHPKAPQQETPLLDYGARSPEQRNGHEVPQSFCSSSAVRRRVQLKVQCWKESSALQVSIRILPPSSRKQWPLPGFFRRLFCRGSVEGSTFVRFQSAELIVNTLSLSMIAHSQ